MLQTEALKILQSGRNTFVTGQPGSGKTYVLNTFIDWARDEDLSVAVTASTGIAATHLGGTTIHSWAGIGIKDSLSLNDLKRIKENGIRAENIKDADVLIIDEISMLDGPRFEMIDQVLQFVRESTQPFGGVQLVVCGDFFQLPPISRDKERIFAFQTQAWQAAQFAVCYLTEQYRHDDDTLSSILYAIRHSRINEEHIEAIQACVIEDPDSETDTTMLFTHNADVDQINAKRLSEIDEAEKVYEMKIRGDKQAAAGLIRGCLAPEVLSLKKGAEVMFVANNFAGRYVNGTRGRVVDFEDEQPVVQVGKRKVIVDTHTWKLQDGDEVIAEITQYPIRLAWAITVHKSQGMSLDHALIDLRRAFEPGMGYVALSRVRTMKGLRLIGINNHALRVDPAITTFDKSLRQNEESDLY